MRREQSEEEGGAANIDNPPEDALGPPTSIEELAEIGAARIRLLELDVDGGAERARSLEGRLAEAREELELALIQARGPALPRPEVLAS